MKNYKKLLITCLMCIATCLCTLGFKMGDIDEVSAARCTHTGGKATCTQKAICVDCGVAYGSVLGHVYENIAAQAATCTEIGWNAYKVCTRENCEYTTYKEIAALGHKISNGKCENAGISGKCTRPGCGEGNVYVPCQGGKATCTEYAKCKWCGEEYGELAAHTWKTVKAQTATCTKEGWVAHQKCSKCNATAINGIEQEIEIEFAWGHDYITEATCTKAGKCSRCGTVKALGHDLESYAAQKATCTEIGWNAYKVCTREDCEYTTYKEIAALGHKISNGKCENAGISGKCTRPGCGEGNVYVPCQGGKATCTEYAKCKWCGEEYGELAAHTWKTVKAQTATCTKEGWVAHQKCSKCNATAINGIEQEIEIEFAWGHDYITEATCTKAGKCSRCGTVKALGHDLESYAAQKATCTEIGWNAYKVCTREDCEYTTYKEIAALGHKISNGKCENAGISGKCTRPGCGEGNVYVPCQGGKATCTEYAKCKWCGEEYGELAAHTWKTVKAQTATCTKEGWVAHQKCSKCNATAINGIEQEIEIEFAWGHDYITEATCTKAGKCSRCGTVKALGHDLESYAAQKATCTEIGWNAYKTCNRCDYTTYKEIAALGHKISNGKCENAGISGKCTRPGCGEGNVYVPCQGGKATCTEYAKCKWCGEEYGELAAHTWKTVKAQTATCTKEGWVAHQKCSKCNATAINGVEQEIEIEAKKPHEAKAGTIKIVAATCMKEGSLSYKCSMCQKTITEVLEKTNDHNYNKEVTNTKYLKSEATCESKAIYYKSCVCGAASENETFEYGKLLPHRDGVWIIDLDATCTEDGRRHQECAVCSASIKTDTIAAKGHVDGEWVIDADATCTEDGRKHQECAVCSASIKTDTIAAKGHVDGEWVIDLDATCTEDGRKHQECAVCSASIKTDTIAAKGHVDGEWVIDADATCTEDGRKHQECAVCSASIKTDTIAAKGHVDGEWVIDADATCTEDGRKHQECAVCSASIKTDTIAAKGHVDGEWVIDADATCTEDGRKHQECAVCSASIKTDTIAAKGHTYTEKNPDDRYLCAEASMEAPATYYYSCVCGEKGEETFFYGEVLYIPTESITLSQSTAEIYIGQPFSLTATVLPINATYSNFVEWTSSDEEVATVNIDGVITAKQAGVTIITASTYNGQTSTCEITVKEGEIEFTLTDDCAFYYVSGYVGYETHIEIPNEYDSLRVIRIAESAFRGKTHIETLTLPNSIEEIDAYAFYGCTSLKAINIPESVKDLNEYTFANCTSLETVTLSDKIMKIGAHAFENCTSLSQIIFSSANENSEIQLEVIDEYAFANCISMMHFDMVEILPKLKIIGVYAFSKCTGLELVTLPTSMQMIDDHAFEYCTGLEDLYVGAPEDETVKSTAVIGACAFTHCTAMEYAMLTGIVETIGKNAFEYCTALQVVDFSEGLIAIKDSAFDYCTALIAIDLPDTLTSIGKMAFRHAESLMYIDFPSQIQTIGNSCFQYCISLYEVVLPENITKLGNSAFSGCRGLVSLTVLGDVENWGDSAFYECQKLENIYIASAHNHEKGGENNYIFYNAGIAGDGITLTIGKTAIIPEGLFIPVERMGNMPKITAIIVEDGATTVNAFLYYNYLPYLTSITLPDTITNMPYGIFNNSPWWIEQEKGVVYIDNVFYGYKCECSYCTPSEIVVENYVDSDCVNDGSYQNVVTCTVCGYEVLRETIIIPAKGHKVLGVEQEVVNYTTQNDTKYPFSISGNQITSTNKANSSSSTYTITAQRAFTLELQYKVSSESNCDWLIIKHNSTQKVKTSGTSTTSFKTLTISMNTGDKVTITYSKDSSQNKGSDCAWVKILTASTEILPVQYVDATEENIAPLLTCTQAVLCVVCNDVVAEALGHDYIYHEAQAVTCLEIGWDEYNTCSRCDYNEYVEIPALGHDYIHHEAQAVTCLEIGWEEYNTCSRCDYNSCAEISMRHNAEGNNGLCLGCGLPESSAGLTYSTNSDGTYEVTDIGSCTETDIVIGFYNGKDVTSIGNSAFYDCDSLTSVVIGDSVTSIGYSAFQYCSGLMSIEVDENNSAYKSIDGNLYSKDGRTLIQYAIGKTAMSFTIPNSVTTIGADAFYNCDSLTSVVIGDSVTTIGSSAFYGCSKLTSVVIPDSVTTIGADAFGGCSALERMTLPFVGGSKTAASASGSTLFGYIFGESSYTGSYRAPQYYAPSYSYTYYIPSTLKSVTITGGNILYGAFYYCDSLTSVVIGDSVRTIGEWAFCDCYSLTSVVIGDSVTTIGERAFYSCISLTSVVIGDSVTTIGDDAFHNCGSLTSVVIPDSVTRIGSYAFYNCYSLRSVVIGDSVTTIGYSAFRYCDRLTSVYYKGTASDWSKISIGSYNTNLTYATRYYYSETEPVLNANGTAYDGNYWRYVDGVATPWVYVKPEE